MDQNSPLPLTVQIVQHLRLGGIEMLALELLRSQNGTHLMHLVSLEGSAEEAFQHWPQLREYADQLTFLEKPPGIHLLTTLKLARFLGRRKVSNVHTHHIGPLLYGGFAARLAGIKTLIHTEHDSWHLHHAPTRRLQKLLLRLLRPKVVADSKHVADELHVFYPFLNSQIIMNGIDTARFIPGDKQKARKMFRLPRKATLIGCAARLEPVKNHVLLLQALRQLPKECHLALAGSGSIEESLKHQATVLDVADQVHFLGHVSDMVSFYQALDLFCLPSLQEGLPLSLLEAQATGVPVIASNVGSCREAIAPEAGTLFTSNDLPGLLDAFKRRLNHTSSTSTRPFILNHFSLERMVSHYQSLCAPKAKEVVS
ncbi:MAG: glycosyltransferase [Rickettsiales bacterium]|nr:glycosyltransferase [Rickettsiales bacterium]